MLPPGAVESMVAGRPVHCSLILAEFVIAIAAVIVFELRFVQSMALQIALMVGALALIQVHARGQWERFTGETVPGFILLSAAWTVLHGIALISALAGEDGRLVGGAIFGGCGVFAIWRASQGREVLAPAPLRFRSATSVQSKGLVNVVVGIGLITSTVVRIPGLWLAVGFLVFVLVQRWRRRRSGLAESADVPQDPRMKAPAWFSVALVIAYLAFLIVAQTVDAAVVNAGG